MLDVGIIKCKFVMKYTIRFDLNNFAKNDSIYKIKINNPVYKFYVNY